MWLRPTVKHIQARPSPAHGGWSPWPRGRTVNRCRPATSKSRRQRAESRERAIKQSSSPLLIHLLPSLPPSLYIIPNFVSQQYKASRFRTSHPSHSSASSPPIRAHSHLPRAPRPAGSRHQDRRPAATAGEAIWPHSSSTGGPPSACASPRRSTRWSPAAPSAPSSPSKCSSSSISL